MSTPSDQYNIQMAKYDHFKKAAPLIREAIREKQGNYDVDWTSLCRLMLEALKAADEADDLHDKLEDSDFVSDLRAGIASPEGFDKIKDMFEKFESLVEKMTSFTEAALEQLDVALD
ncbi:hypothetical protein F4818DRAFT_443786 [Hypoxylon cercidicola]|nr:hypothetical protein F4818DRAFT_443786 [Hypoxylon cercidicola]